MARDAIRGSSNGSGHQLSIEVRDEAGPVMQVKFTFEAHPLRH
jgi:hypothetical protein